MKASRWIAQSTFIVYLIFGFGFVLFAVSALARGGNIFRLAAMRQNDCGCALPVVDVSFLDRAIVTVAALVLGAMVVRTIFLVVHSRRSSTNFMVTSEAIFCAGLLRPKIFFGGEALKKLTREERLAVETHEQYHVLQRDPLRLLIVDVVTFPFRFLPGLKNLHKEFRSSIEVAADEYVIAKVGSIFLSQALLKFTKQEDQVAVVSFSGATNLRVDQLLGQRVWIRSLKVLLVLVFVVSGAMLVLHHVHAQVANDLHQAVSTRVGICHQQQPKTCIAPQMRSVIPPSWTPVRSSSIDLMSSQ